MNKSKELFSDAYVRAVVAAAGMHVEPRAVDVDSVDGYIHYTGSLDGAFSPQIAFQLKCTAATDAVEAAEQFPFVLPVKNYSELSVANTTVPRILIVVLVPAEMTGWIEHADEEMLVRRCAYWRSLQGEPPTQNRVSRTVEIAKTHAFTVDALNRMMRNVAAGVSP